MNKHVGGIVFYNDDLLNAKNDDEELSMDDICPDRTVFGSFVA